MSIRTPFSAQSGSMRTALESNRDMNIPLNAALGELLDNSIEHGASRVWIEYTPKSATVPERIVVVDDGFGMAPDVLVDHLTVGFHKPAAGKDTAFTIGKYGVGSKYAFANVCRKSEVWSKTSSGKWHKAEFNYDDEHLGKSLADWIAEGTGYPHDAVMQDPPAELEKYWNAGKDHGTVVVWTGFDRAVLTAGTTDELTWWIERTYRKFIGDHKVITGSEGRLEIAKNPNPIEVHFDGKPLTAYDPLYLIPHREGDIGGDLEYSTIVIPYPIDDPTWQKRLGSGTAYIRVRFGLCPAEWREVRKPSRNSPESGVTPSAEDSKNVVERRIQGASASGSEYAFWNSQRYSFLRAGREVGWAFDWTLIGSRSEAIDRWWGMEIEFGPELDDAFRVRHVKYQVSPEQKLKKKIRQEIKSTLSQIRDDISAHFTKRYNEREAERRRSATKAPGPGPKPIEPPKESLPDPTGEVPDTTESPDEMVHRIFGQDIDLERFRALRQGAHRELRIESDN